MADKRAVRVLFVCLGNICRSPTAHGVFQSLAAQRASEFTVEVESCGTAHWHIGEPPDSRSAAEAAKRGYDLSALRGRQIQYEDFAYYDFILGMDEENIANLNAICPAEHKGKVELFLAYASQAQEREVPDPYYGGDAGFAHVLDLIEEASKGLLDEIAKRSSRGAYSG